MYKKIIKRFLDIFFTIITLPFLIILFIIVGFSIKIDDKGPIIYSSMRIGQNGKFFKMYKFRTMTTNSPDIRLQDGSTFNSVDDPRVTRVGRFLRRTSIDEIPQLINVLIGQMSLIGPRPDPTDWLNKYSEEVKYFLTVKPGISGYNQAYFRNSADGYQKMENDLYYAKKCTFKMDVNIFFKTIVTVLKKENINKK